MWPTSLKRGSATTGHRECLITQQQKDAVFEGVQQMSECGTNAHYMAGCRCPDCTEAHRARAREYRRRKNAGEVASPFRYADKQQESVPLPAETGPGPVEVGVEAEIGGVVDARPGLTQVALAMARLLDDSKAKNQQPAAAKVLVSVLNELRSEFARGRRGKLALVRQMSDKGGA